MLSFTKKIFQFLKTDIWHVQIAKLSKPKACAIRFLRIILLTSQGFTKSQIQQGASALTYYSLLAVVPIIALLIGIARGFQLEHTLETFLLQRFSEQATIIKQIFQFANASLEQARGGIIAGIGIAILVWSTIKILTNIEFVFNQIWEVKKGRPLVKQFTDYLSIIFLAPIIIFLATGFTGYLSAVVSGMHKGGIFEHFATVLIPIFSISSYLLISFLFTFLYLFMPNTRVWLIPALIAGLFTGAVYQILQWLYFYFQIGVASYNAIYGTFAALPLFLVWLHLSWVTTLLGAKLCFAIQNVDAYEFLSEDADLSYQVRTICCLRIVHLCIKKFVNEQTPPSSLEISNELAIPLLLTSQFLFQLVGAGVLAEIKQDDKEEAFQPARNVECLTIKRVIDMINEKGASISLPPSKELTLILKSLEKFSVAVEQSDGNVLLKNI